MQIRAITEILSILSNALATSTVWPTQSISNTLFLLPPTAPFESGIWPLVIV